MDSDQLTQLIQAMQQQSQQQMQQLQQQQQQFLLDFAKQFNGNRTTTAQTTTGPVVDDFGSLQRDLPQYVHLDDGSTKFEDWHDRYGPVIDRRGTSLSDDSKREIVIGKLDQASYKLYTQNILPKKYTDFDLPETIQKLKELLGPNKSLCKRRFECMQTMCPPLTASHIPYRDSSNSLKKHFEEADMSKIDPETHKCLLFTLSLSDPSHSEIRLRLINKMNTYKDPNFKPDFNEMVEECITYAMTRAENRNLDAKEIKFVKKNNQKTWNRSRHSSRERPLQSSNNRRQESPARRRPTTSPSKPRRFAKNVVAFSQAADARTFTNVDINGRPAKLQVDTGADITLVSRQTWNDIGSPALEKTSMSIKTADGSPMALLGRFNADYAIHDVNRRKHKGTGPCYVTENTDLIGLEWLIVTPQYCNMRNELNCRMTSTNLDTIREDAVSSLQQRFPDVFSEGLGRCTKTKAKLFLKHDARPTYCKKRPLPLASQSAIDAELNRLTSEGVLTAVDYSEWAAPIVPVKKSNGSIRMCADFSTGLNDSLMLHQHPLPTAEDVFNKLNLQIEVDEPSKELLTINTHRGLFRYNRLPFGVKSAPGIFQQIIDSMISGLPGVAAYLDDIIVTGRSTDEHRQNLEALFERIHSYGFRVRLPKCNFLMSEIRYLGHIIDKNGRRPDPEKIRAINKMPPPKDVPQLRSFLGMITYYGCFIDKMRQLRAPLDALLKKDTPFTWSTECQQAFDRAKEVLASPLLLTHYDPKLDLIVAADASDYGIGAVILHRFPDGTEKAISHASRSLTDAERKYAQIEKEGLALVFAIRKFHRYLFGRRFTLLTDHKPLLAIFGNKKGLPVYTANRLLRWSLILLGYDFKIEYHNTTKFGQADALSRLIAEGTSPTEDIVIAQAVSEADAEFRAAAAFVPVTMKEVAKELAQDEVLRDVINYVRTDKWPKNRHPAIVGLYGQRQSLSIQDDCLFFGHRIIVPTSLRRRVLEELHDGHPGENRMKMLARQHVFWTNINDDIANFVKSCPNCQEVQKAPVKTELFSWPREEHPWSRIHIDYAGPFDGKMYLVVIDAFSKWPEIIEMASTTSTATIRQLNRLFAQFGFPETLVSDNGTQFTSSEFADFCKSNGITHVRSPPFHPQSNGQAERFVDTFKRAMLKIKDRGTTTEALQKFLMVYRRTPCSSSPESRSPAENFLGRPLRTTLSLLNPPRSILKHRDEQMEDQFNRHHNARPKRFELEDLVWVRDFRVGQPRWVTGQVLLRHGNALYDVLVDDRVQRRHANQMRPRLANNSEFTLADTFDLPKAAPEDTETLPPPTPTYETAREIDSSESESDSDNVQQPAPVTHTRPQRQRRAPVKLEINPRAKSYA